MKRKLSQSRARQRTEICCMRWANLPPCLSKTFPHRQTCIKIRTLSYEVGQATEVSVDRGKSKSSFEPGKKSALYQISNCGGSLTVNETPFKSERERERDALTASKLENGEKQNETDVNQEEVRCVSEEVHPERTFCEPRSLRKLTELCQ